MNLKCNPIHSRSRNSSLSDRFPRKAQIQGAPQDITNFLLDSMLITRDDSGTYVDNHILSTFLDFVPKS